MSAAYVRERYGVTFKRGDRVTVDGKPGTVVSFPHQYVGVRFDGERRTSHCHPTWRVQLITPPRVERLESGLWAAYCDHGEVVWYLERRTEYLANRSLTAHRTECAFSPRPGDAR